MVAEDFKNLQKESFVILLVRISFLFLSARFLEEPAQDFS
jgi:hypothetical protein